MASGPSRAVLYRDKSRRYPGEKSPKRKSEGILNREMNELKPGDRIRVAPSRPPLFGKRVCGHADDPGLGGVSSVDRALHLAAA